MAYGSSAEKQPTTTPSMPPCNGATRCVTPIVIPPTGLGGKSIDPAFRVQHNAEISMPRAHNPEKSLKGLAESIAILLQRTNKKATLLIQCLV
jgi:hypothetical protein